MTTQIIRDTTGVITTGKFCQFGIKKKTNTGSDNGSGGSSEMPPNEIHFTTIAGSVEYWGNQGDQILLSDDTIVDVTITDEAVAFNAPEGKHRVKLVESVDRYDYVSIGGEALVELHNFPTLSSVNAFNAHSSPNLVRVPTVLPSNITSLSGMFGRSDSFNQDISMWDTSNVTNMNGMFDGAISFNQDISGWDVSNVTDMSYMFFEATAFDQPLNSWNVSNVTEMNTMFYVATAFNHPLNNWDVSNVTNMSGMFSMASVFDQPLNNWNVSNVTDMDNMFYDAFAFNHPLNNWDVSNVTNMSGMFSNAIAFDQPLNNWNVSNVTDIGHMFFEAISFNQDLSSWCVTNIKSPPTHFDYGTTNWTLPRPVWGTCPV